MDELKPCPFCGYNMANEEDGAYQKAGFVGPQTPVWEVCCGSAACNASVSTTSRESAITAWNTRPREDAGVVDEAMAERALKALIQEEVEQFGYASTPYNGARTACMKAALAAALGKA